MPVIIDVSFWEAANFSNPFSALWQLIKIGGWFLILLPFLKYGPKMWLLWRQEKWAYTLKWVLLAIDVPRENIQSTKAVEQVFATIAGAKRNFTKWETWWHGMYNLEFSFEVVSIDGYIQFLIRCEGRYRNLVESAIYAQYPQAEIFEVEDYTRNMPKEFPNDEYDIWGTEYVLDKKVCYPIRTYPLFEHTLTQVFVDPMASILENMASLKKGEQIWYQITAVPATDNWKEGCISEVYKLIGKKVEIPKSLLQRGLERSLAIFRETHETTLASLFTFPAGEGAREETGPPSLMQHLSPGEVTVVQAIQNKIAKMGFYTKIRAVYIGKKEVYEQLRMIAQFHGALKQFNSLDLNSFGRGRYTTTKADYFFVNWRKNRKRKKLMRACKSRDMDAGEKEIILNIEELASLWHFPIMEVKAPLIKKTEAKKAEPPVSLPIEGQEMPIRPVELKLPTE